MSRIVAGQMMIPRWFEGTHRFIAVLRRQWAILVLLRQWSKITTDVHPALLREAALNLQ